jgi:hypothetical protein
MIIGKKEYIPPYQHRKHSNSVDPIDKVSKKSIEYSNLPQILEVNNYFFSD